MIYEKVEIGKDNIIINFKNHEPIIIWDFNEAMRLTIDLCTALHKSFKDKD